MRALFAACSVLLFIALLSASQMIPNPNQDRLGMPSMPAPPPPDNTQHRINQSRYSHAEALKEAEELCNRTQHLRDRLKAAGDYVVPVAAIDDTQKIEKLARKLRGELKR